MNNRVYRSTSESMLGGVAAGLARYFNIDPVLVRLGFVLGTLVMGWPLLVYLVLWLVLPSPSSTADDVGGIMRENVNELTSRLRPEQTGNGGNVASTPGNGGAAGNGGQVNAQARQGMSGSSLAWVLILLGGFFLMGSMHITNWHAWGLFWPAALLVAGIWLLRRNRA